MKLKNWYYAIRHGEGLATVKGIIVSDPRLGMLPRWGLTERGRYQVLQRIVVADERGLFGENPIIVSSPFSRCTDGAEIITKIVLGFHGEFQSDDRLCERWFGGLEGQSIQNYQKVWDQDLKNPDHQLFGVESARAVSLRVMNVIVDLERQHKHRKIFFSSHGDVLQIAEAVIKGLSPGQHRQLPHLELAEIRELIPVSKTLTIKV